MNELSTDPNIVEIIELLKFASTKSGCTLDLDDEAIGSNINIATKLLNMMCYIANDNNDVGKAHELFNVSLVLIRFASGDSNVKRSLDKHRAARYANNNQIVSDNDELNNQALDLLIKRADDNHTRLTSSFESERTHFGEKFYDAAVSRDYETLAVLLVKI